MKRYERSHLANHVLLQTMATHLRENCATTAELLADLAEVEARKLYVPAGYPSMHQYCLDELHMSEGSAYKRLRVARVAREFPAIFDAVAEGRLHLSALMLLEPRLTNETVGELLTAAAHKTKAAVELLLAERFPKADVPKLLEPAAPTVAGAESVRQPTCESERMLSPGTICEDGLQQDSNPAGDPKPAPAGVNVAQAVPHSKLSPLAPKRFALQTTVDEETHELLRHAQDLIGRGAPAAEIPQVLKAALTDFLAKLEKKRFAATSNPRPRRGAPKGRHIPAEVKRAVAKRDGGRCTFVSDRGKRCPATTHLELDHVDPVARGGRATMERMRLRCRAHNQYTAERTFGAGFMAAKREGARHQAAKKREASQKSGSLRAPKRGAAREHQAATARELEEAKARALEAIPWLAQMGRDSAEANRDAP